MKPYLAFGIFAVIGIGIFYQFSNFSESDVIKTSAKQGEQVIEKHILKKDVFGNKLYEKKIKINKDDNSNAGIIKKNLYDVDEYILNKLYTNQQDLAIQNALKCIRNNGGVKGCISSETNLNISQLNETYSIDAKVKYSNTLSVLNFQNLKYSVVGLYNKDYISNLNSITNATNFNDYLYTVLKGTPDKTKLPTSISTNYDLYNKLYNVGGLKEQYVLRDLLPGIYIVGVYQCDENQKCYILKTKKTIVKYTDVVINNTKGDSNRGTVKIDAKNPYEYMGMKNLVIKDIMNGNKIYNVGETDTFYPEKSEGEIYIRYCKTKDIDSNGDPKRGNYCTEWSKNTKTYSIGGIVANYNFDNVGINGIITDQSNEGNNGIFKGDVLYAFKNKENGNSLFVSKNYSNYVKFNLNSSFNVGIGVDMFVSPVGVRTNNGVLLNMKKGTDRFKIYRDGTSNGLKIELKINGRKCIGTLNNVLEDGKWQQLSVSYNSQEKKIKLYKNKNLIGTKDCSSSLGNNNKFEGTIDEVNLMGDNIDGGISFNGLVDNFYLYNKDLTEEAISKHYDLYNRKNDVNLPNEILEDKLDLKIGSDFAINLGSKLSEYDFKNINSNDNGIEDTQNGYLLKGYNKILTQELLNNAGKFLYLSDDNNSYLNIEGYKNKKFKAGYTFEAWVGPNNINKNQRVFEYGDESNHIALYNDLGNKDGIFELKEDGAVWCKIKVNNLLEKNKWNFVGFKYSKLTDKYSIFKNGILVKEGYCSNTKNITIGNNRLENFYIGKSNDENIKNFDGYISDIVNYNRPINSEKIINHYNSTKNNYDDKAFWNAEENVYISFNFDEILGSKIYSKYGDDYGWAYIEGTNKAENRIQLADGFDGKGFLLPKEKKANVYKFVNVNRKNVFASIQLKKLDNNDSVIYTISNKDDGSYLQTVIKNGKLCVRYNGGEKSSNKTVPNDGKFHNIVMGVTDIDGLVLYLDGKRIIQDKNIKEINGNGKFNLLTIGGDKGNIGNSGLRNTYGIFDDPLLYYKKNTLSDIMADKIKNFKLNEYINYSPNYKLSCLQYKNSGKNNNGLYTIQQLGKQPLIVYCDMNRGGKTIVYINKDDLVGNQELVNKLNSSYHPNYEDVCQYYGMDVYTPVDKKTYDLMADYKKDGYINIIGIRPMSDGSYSLKNWYSYVNGGTIKAPIYLFNMEKDELVRNGGNANNDGFEPNGDNKTSGMLYGVRSPDSDYKLGKFNDANDNNINKKGEVYCGLIKNKNEIELEIPQITINGGKINISNINQYGVDVFIKIKNKKGTFNANITDKVYSFYKLDKDIIDDYKLDKQGFDMGSKNQLTVKVCFKDGSRCVEGNTVSVTYTCIFGSSQIGKCIIGH